jgi:hypothetical protein
MSRSLRIEPFALTAFRNPKSEIRSPKEIRNPKPERGCLLSFCSDFGLRPSFGLRISDFGFLTSCAAKLLWCGLAFAALSQPTSTFACAACYGKSDSPLATGMNWGIFSLLAVVVPVLGSIAAFFFFMARRAAANPLVASPKLPQPAPSASPTQ